MRWVASVQVRPAGAEHHVGVSRVPMGPKGRSAVEDGAALSSARRRKNRTYPELCGPHNRARLVVLAAETGGRWSEPSWPQQRRGQFPTSCVVALARLGSTGGRCLVCAASVPWTVVPHMVLTGQLPPHPWFSLHVPPTAGGV